MYGRGAFQPAGYCFLASSSETDAGDDDVLALLPVHRRRDLVLRRQLQRIDHAQHLVEVAAGRHRVDEDQLDLLVRPDDEHVAHGLVVGRGAPCELPVSSAGSMPQALATFSSGSPIIG